jgi:hypothetical protein
MNKGAETQSSAATLSASKPQPERRDAARSRGTDSLLGASPAPSPPEARPARSRVRRVLAEPLTHFVVAGLALFAAGRVYQGHADLHRIVVTPAHVRQLANDYALQFGQPPDAGALAELERRDLHDEILYRQALALKLDRDDPIVRRRLVQKMQFLLQDTRPPAEPSEQDLRAYYAAHAERYRAPAKISFTHIFFSGDANGDVAARTRAAQVLRTLKPDVTRAPALGDPFPDLYDFSAYEPDQVYRLFGHTPFAEATLSAPGGRWVGPYRSGYGWHLLYVGSRTPAAAAPLDAVREQARADALQDAQERANQAAFAELARGFRVVHAGEEPRP